MFHLTRPNIFLCCLSISWLVLASACSDSTNIEPGPDAEDVVSGDSVIEPDTREPRCGDGILDDGEECDDENGVDADACSNDCELNDADLCQVCETNDDCGGGGRCLEQPEGMFCGFDCSDSADYCPEGFECLDVTDPDDSESVIAQQCFPLDNCGAVDECTLYPDICGPGVCTDEEVGFSCLCDEGYEATGDDPVCVDVDECEDLGLCGVGTCENSEGGFACDCPFPYEESGGDCVLCPSEFALTLTTPSTADCAPLAESDHQALLDQAITNFGRVTRHTLEAPRFIDLSPIVRALVGEDGPFGCESREGECFDGIPFDEAAEYIDQIVEVLEEELLASELVTDSNACSMTIELSSDMLCDSKDEPLPEYCAYDDDCPGDYFCNQNLTVCERKACTIDDDCRDDYVCGDDNFCEEDACIFEELPISIVAWPVGDDNVYAEIIVGSGADAANPIDVRIFSDQLSIIADLKAVVETAYLVSEAEGDTEPMWPAVEDVEGILEIDLHEVEEGHYAIEINVRKADPASPYAGVYATWTIDDLFDSYVNETPLPLTLEVAEACPLLFVDIDDSADVLSIGTGVQPIEALVPFALVNNGDGDNCDGPCPCYDDTGAEIACPCYDDDGMPVICETTTAAECPYDSDGNQDACLPNVGSLKLHLAGQSIRATMSVIDELEDQLRIDRIGFGDSITSLERNYSSDDEFVPVVTFSHNLTTVDRMSSVVLRLAEDNDGGVIDLISDLELDATVDTINITDRITDMPDMLDGEVMRVLFTGDDPHLRVTITDNPVRPVELLSGTLTLYSNYLEENEEPARTPPGTITVAAGECIVEMLEFEEGSDPHIFEAIEGQTCPDTAPVIDDVAVLVNEPTMNFNDDEDMSVGAGRVALMTFDLTDLPATVTSAHLDIYLDWTNPTLSDDFGAFEVTQAWVASEVTWDTQPTTTTTATGSVSANDLLDENDGYISFDVTSLVNSWLATPTANHGLALKNTTSTGFASFRTQEYDRGRRAPRLVITE